MFIDSTIEEIDATMQKSWQAFDTYKKTSMKERANFMRTIAQQLEHLGALLIQTAMRETNLAEARLRSERSRTIHQLTSYAEACETGSWLDVSIDTAIPRKIPSKPDLRKMNIPLGPVVVFGASNFPFAYSTAGGDTACALAAGCPVILKAHPAHAETSEMVASAILKAAEICQIPEGVFSHLHGSSNLVGETLVKHPFTKAVGFTGSFTGGKQLFDWGNQRKVPIPVFAEMGSVNPVFLLPEKLHTESTSLAKLVADSIIMGMGQFCTNPGVIIGMKGDDLNQFVLSLINEIKRASPLKMLHPSIATNFYNKRKEAMAQANVSTLYESTTTLDNGDSDMIGHPTITTTSAKVFIQNPNLHQEVFGPYSIIVQCESMSELIEVAHHMEGQLTTTLMATEADILNNEALIELVKNCCGRLILNNVPTGVEVCKSMHHGGPFPATTDSRFTSVGADGIKRFVRPFCFQNWPSDLLPDELKNNNPLQLWRTVNNELTKEPVCPI